MSIRTKLLAVLAAVTLAACQTTPQAPIALTKEKVTPPSAGRVGVVMNAHKVDLYLPGAGCLLCLAAATVANKSLNTYAQQTLKDDELVAVKGELVEALQKRGLQATLVAEQVNFGDLPTLSLGDGKARHDFARFNKQFDRLVVVEVGQIGFVRNYAAYVPTGDAVATIDAQVYMVDLKTNAYDWYDHIVLTKAADGAWDEAPSFPGLTNAFYQTIEQAKDRIKKPIVSLQ